MNTFRPSEISEEQKLLRYLSTNIHMCDPKKNASILYAMNPLERYRFYEYASQTNVWSYLYWSLGSYADKLMPDAGKRITEMNRNFVAMRKKLNETFAALENNRIRYCVFKGIDLAEHVYPHPSCRLFVDCDLLIHFDDIIHGLQVINQLGWNPHTTLCTSLPKHHHFPVHTYKIFRLEPHWALPNMEKVSVNDLWQELKIVPGTRFRYFLPNELNLLMLVQHFSTRSYLHTSLPRFLLDTAYILKNQRFDWNKLRFLIKKWDLPSPENLLSVYPEFFSSEDLNSMQCTDEAVQLYRLIFRIRSSINYFPPGEVEINNFIIGNMKCWILHRLSSFHPVEIRHRYKLGQHCPVWQFIFAYMRLTAQQIKSIAKYAWRISPILRNYNQLVHRANFLSRINNHKQ